MNGIREDLRVKLDSFIRKYYQNKLLKGLIYFVGLGISYFLIVVCLEYFGQFNRDVRLALFMALLLGLLIILVSYIVLPVLGLARIGRHLSYKDAARIIGQFFPEVSDRVTNTLELSGREEENALIKASIDQRIASLKPVPFTKAVDYKENVRYWPVLVIPVVVFLGLIVSGQWTAIKDSGRRIVEYNKDFLPEAPFEFVLLNESLKAEQGDNFTIMLKFSGKSVPESAEFFTDGRRARFVKAEPNLFEYRIENIQDNLQFGIEANGFRSSMYEIDVVPVPVLRSLTMRIIPPVYTGLKAFTGEGRSVVDVPEGSEVIWSLKGENIDFAGFETRDSIVYFTRETDNFHLNRRVVDDLQYKLITGNEEVSKRNDADNRVNVIKDQYPDIEVEFMADSVAPNVVFYRGSVSDDYGVRRLTVEVSEGDRVLGTSVLSVSKNSLGERISGVIDMDSLKEYEGRIEVRLVVWDNDGVNGSKSSKSESYYLNLLSANEQKKQVSKQYESYFEQKEELQKVSESLLEDIRALRNKLMNDKKANWNDKEKLKELMEKQEEVLRKQAELEKMKENAKAKEENIKEKSEDIKEKEEKIEDIKEDSKQKELEELMKEIDQLMDKLDIEQLKEKLDKMEQLSSENMRQEDRVDELLKDLQFQKEILEQSEKMQQLSQKMEELSQKQDNGELDEQEKVGKEFEKVKEKVEEMKKENEAFAEETEEQELDKSSKEAEKSMEESSDQLQKSQESKANEKQKEASDKMQEMSDKMTMSMMQMQSQQHMENMKTLRQILENLEILSTDIEDLSALSKQSGKSDPLYRKLLVDQHRLQEGSKIIRDSLVALSERVPEIREDVFKELNDIDNNLEKSIQTLEDQNGPQSAAYQQFVMTAANNLALLLDQALRNMQQQMAAMMKGDQSCQKPGGGKPSLENMRKMQGELGDMMKKMQGKKPGKGEGRGGKEIVEMLSRQEQIRRALEDYKSEKEGKGGSKGKLDKALEEMKELEKDMLEGRISLESLERIKEIETRLLESEKADLERRKDEKREAKTSENISQLYKEELEKYLNGKDQEREELYMTPLEMRIYYKNRSNKYLTQP